MTVPSSPGTPAPAIGPSTRASTRIPLFTADAWAPLKTELFRSLWIATSIAQIGTWTREAAGPTLMENLTHTSPIRAEMVARVLIFSNLPICLFSVFAGALADVLDRRRLLIATQIWMIVVSVVLGVLTYAGWIRPGALLAFTFLLGVGTAAFGPALQAVLPELVPREHFALAINMNSIALNVARAVGPAIFILVVTVVPGNKGAGVSFMLTGASFLAAVWVLYRWKRPPQVAALAGEEIWGAIRAGYHYTIHSPANRAILLRVAAFIIPALVIWSQVPIIATSQLHRMASNEVERQQISALLFAFMGLGAILGVFLMPGLHARYKIDPVVNVCTGFFGIGLILLSYVHTLLFAAIILIFLGINWVIIPTNFNTATQKSVPPWVKGRAISFYLTVLFGSFALGGFIWGKMTHAHGIHTTLLLGGVSMLALLTLAKWFPLTLNEGKDLSPAYKTPPADLIGVKPEGNGPLRTAIRYRVPTHRSEPFKDLLAELRRTRLRNGARQWQMEEAAGSNNQSEISEIITFSSWQQYSRSFSRATKWDLMQEGLAREYFVSNDPVTLAPAEPRWIFPPIPFLSGDGQRTFLASATSVQNSEAARRTSLWLRDRIANGFDRALDEIFVAYDRLAPSHKRKAASRPVTIHLPVLLPHDQDAGR
jgi:MFS family permease